MTSLSSILNEVNVVLPRRDIDFDEIKQLYSISEGCHSVLDELNDILEKYQEIGSDFKSYNPEDLRTKIQRGWKRLKWRLDDLNELRSRITSIISLLNAFHAGFATYLPTSRPNDDALMGLHIWVAEATRPEERESTMDTTVE